MLSISKVGSASGRYYLKQAQSGEEFSPEKPGEKPGKWIDTEGAKTFGLDKRFDQREFQDSLHGFGADGDTRLVQNAGKPKRVPGWDCVFSAPKDVAALWAISGKEVQARIEACHEQAVKKGVAYLESVVVMRRDQGGSRQEPAKLIVAGFEHSRSRAGEPDLHTHAVVINIGVSKNHTGSLHSSFLYEHKMVAGAIYRAELAARLEQSLGLTLTREQSWFEVQGLSRYKSLLQSWSSRSEAIRAQNPRDARHAQAIAYRTRPQQITACSRAQAFAQWRAEATQHGLTQQKVEKILSSPPRTRSLLSQKWQEWCAVREARKSLLEKQSHFSRADVVRAIACASPGRGLDADKVIKLSDRYLQSRQVMDLGDGRFTTKRTWKLEQSMLKNASHLSFTRAAARVKERSFKAVEKQFALTNEQHVALREVCDRRRALTVLDGPTGSGKTQVLAAAAHAYRDSGYHVVAVSPSRAQAEKLTQATQIGASGSRDEQSLSIAQVFARIDWAKENRRSSPLQKDSVVLIEDAHKLSAWQIDRVMREAHDARAKIVLTGSTQLMQAIEHGGAFRGVVERLREQGGQAVSTLTYSLRQAKEQDRQIVEHFQNGQAVKALRALVNDKRLRVQESREEAASVLVSAWAARHGGDLRHHLLIGPSKEEARRVNELAQASRLMAGDFKDSRALRVGKLELHEGDRIRFTENDRLNGLTKGELGTVLKVNPLNRSLTVKLDTGIHRTLFPSRTKGIELGYAVTTHEAQTLEPLHSYVLSRGFGKEAIVAQMGRARSSNLLVCYGVPEHSPLGRIAYGLEQKQSMDLATSIHRQQQKQEEPDLELSQERSR